MYMCGQTIEYQDNGKHKIQDSGYFGGVGRKEYQMRKSK